MPDTVIVREIASEVIVYQNGGPQEVLQSVSPVTEVITVAEQGPPGPAGDNAEGATFEAAVDIGGHRGVMLNQDGKLEYADASDVTHAGRLVGISLNAAVADDDVETRWSGEVIEPSWSWTPGANVFLGADGVLTHTPVSAGFLQRVGYAVSQTKLFLQIGEPILLS